MVNPNEHQVQLIDEICRSTNYPRYWVAGRTMDTYLASEAGRNHMLTAVQSKCEQEECLVRTDDPAEVVKGGVADMDFVLPENLTLRCDDAEKVTDVSYKKMKEREEKLVNALAESEKLLESFRADTSEKYRGMERMKNSVEEIKEAIRQLVEQYRVVMNDYCTSTENTKRQEAINGVISEQLQKTREQLVKLQRIFVCVYSTVNELKGVAKLLLMVKTFREVGREVDVIFENHNLEDLWENING